MLQVAVKQVFVVYHLCFLIAGVNCVLKRMIYTNPTWRIFPRAYFNMIKNFIFVLLSLCDFKVFTIIFWPYKLQSLKGMNLYRVSMSNEMPGQRVCPTNGTKHRNLQKSENRMYGQLNKLPIAKYLSSSTETPNFHKLNDNSSNKDNNKGPSLLINLGLFESVAIWLFNFSFCV